MIFINLSTVTGTVLHILNVKSIAHFKKLYFIDLMWPLFYTKKRVSVTCNTQK